ncbi:MAG: electron transfer flavoprotein subunit beta/FixA family protein [Deltaproteobacteria bacterium]|nr:electron transfer flavoprotein subunit beta/FixA family protein [Deltaproteobacteria bacterium]
MNSIICLKQVPDTEAQLKIQSDAIGTDGVKFIISPYDEYGIEEALLQKEKAGSGEVTLVCMGPDRCVEAIRTGLAMGADKAVHLDDPAFEGSDALTTAKVLSDQIKSMEYDVIYCGKQAIDDDQSQVGVALAEYLGLPHASLVTKVEIADGKAKVNRQIVGGEEVLELPLPCVITAQKGLNEPRYASLPGIMKAKKKPLSPVKAADIGIDVATVGAAGSKTKSANFVAPAARTEAKVIAGESAEEKAVSLAKALREEAKAI